MVQICSIGDLAKLDGSVPASGNSSPAGNANIPMQFSLWLPNLRLGWGHIPPFSCLLPAARSAVNQVGLWSQAAARGFVDTTSIIFFGFFHSGIVQSLL